MHNPVRVEPPAGTPLCAYLPTDSVLGALLPAAASSTEGRPADPAGRTRRVATAGAVRLADVAPGGAVRDEVVVPAESHGTLWPAVRRASVELRRTLATAPDQDPDLPLDEIDAALESLTASWRRAYRTGRPALDAPRLPARALLDRLRTAFLAELSRPSATQDFGEAMRMLSALELVREQIERDEGYRFGNEFAGTRALDLLVEVAHDMRSPLTAVLLLSDIVRHEQGISALGQQHVSLVYSAAFGLNALVNDIIDLARDGGRLVERPPVSFSIGDVLQSTTDIVRPLAEERGLSLQQVGPTVDSRVGHPLAVSRVLVNLMTNALKYTEHGEVRVVVRELSRTRVEFAVEDTGNGIVPEVMDTLFEPFRRSTRKATPQSAFSSTGLGLAICRRLVRAMGGELGVETEVDHGSRFFFQLEMPPAPQRI